MTDLLLIVVSRSARVLWSVCSAPYCCEPSVDLRCVISWRWPASFPLAVAATVVINVELMFLCSRHAVILLAVGIALVVAVVGGGW